MKTYTQLLNEISPEIAARLAGARASQGKGYIRKSNKAMKGANKRAIEQGRDPKEWGKTKMKAYELGQKSGRVTSKNIRNPRWQEMKDRPDRILTAKYGTVY